MLDALKQLFGSKNDTAPKTDNDRLHVVTAALLLEVCRADYQRNPAELQTIKTLLHEHFGVELHQLESLLAEASERFEAENALHPFTRFINDNCSDEEKFQLISHAWQVAWVDGSISKYEEHLIRHLAELIYLPHSAFIRAKLDAQAAVTSS